MSFKRVNSDYKSRSIAALASVSQTHVEAVVARLRVARRERALVLLAGNGGSAATANHMAVDLGLGSERFNVGLRTVSLCDNQAVLTAWSNDVGFEDVFAAQIKLLASPRDVVILISASGNSPNVLKAAAIAIECHLDLVTFTGFDGGLLRSMSELGVHAETARGDYGPAEDAHLAVNHWIADSLRRTDHAKA